MAPDVLIRHTVKKQIKKTLSLNPERIKVLVTENLVQVQGGGSSVIVCPQPKSTDTVNW